MNRMSASSWRDAFCWGLSMMGTLLACGRPMTFDDVVRGAVPLAAADRTAIIALVDSASITPADIRLAPVEEGVFGPAPMVQIEGGRVTALALDALAEADAAASLDALRVLRLTGSFPSLRLRDLEALTHVDVQSQGHALRVLTLVGLPSLTTLTIHGGDLVENLRLNGLDALDTLSIGDARLTAVPTFDAPRLRELALPGNTIRDLGGLDAFEGLESLRLDANGLTSLETLPRLPRLRALGVADNPLGPNARLDATRLPALERLDVRRTGIEAVPAGGLATRDHLRVTLDPAVAEQRELASVLDDLRAAHDNAPGTLVQALGSTRGTIVGSKGRCTWRTGSHHRARADCRFTLREVRGLAGLRLGETEITMPYAGGGAPRLRVTVTATQGTVAVYLRYTHDHIAVARTITGVETAVAEAARRPGDRFEGYRRVEAQPGSPAVVEGEPNLLGSRVVIWLEATDGTARDVEVVIASL